MTNEGDSPGPESLTGEEEPVVEPSSLLRNLFHATAETIQNSSSSSSSSSYISDTQKLELYGLYKRCTVGRIEDSSNSNSNSDEIPEEPSKWNVVAYRKYHAWKHCDDLELPQAMEEYARVASTLDGEVGEDCRRLLQRYHSEVEALQVKGQGRGQGQGQGQESGPQPETEMEAENGQSSQQSLQQLHLNNFNDDNNGKEGNPSVTKCIPSSSSPSITVQGPASAQALPAALLNVPPRKKSRFERYTGIQPFVPRGRLDITYADLCFALLQCCKPTNFVSSLPFLEAPMRRMLRLEHAIAKTWKEYMEHGNGMGSTTTTNDQCEVEVLTGLSVRSLLDLYLSSKSYPKDSEVIIVPPISIEGMVHVMQYHNIKIVPVDIHDQEQKHGDDNDASHHHSSHPVVHVDLDQVREKMNDKTVAIFIVHPFGLVCTDDNEMKQLRCMVEEHNAERSAKKSSTSSIEIWEDCAECFTGNYGYRGSPYADVQYFSFGTIKTATALGGGICVLLNHAHHPNSNTKIHISETAEKMKRMEQMMYGQQTSKEYGMKIAKAFLLQFISGHVLLLGIVVWIMSLFGWKYDECVTSMVKGFPEKKGENGCRKGSSSHDEMIEQRRLRIQKLMQRLRKQPNPAMLSLLHRRLRNMHLTTYTVQQRIKRCTRIKDLLEQYHPSIKIPKGTDGGGNQHLYWLFPIVIPNPDELSARIRDFGYDVPRGTSQLGCVTAYLDNPGETTTNTCPNTMKMMKSILYLPISSMAMSDMEMKRIVSILIQTSKDPHDESHRYLTATTETPTMTKLFAPSWSFVIILSAWSACVLDSWTLQILPFTTIHVNALKFLFVQLLPCAFVTAFFLLFSLHVLRVKLGRYYLNCSSSFARYNAIRSESLSTAIAADTDQRSSVDFTPPALAGSGAELIDSNEMHKQNYDLAKHTILRLPESRVGDEDENDNNMRRVLLAGGTGFIGSLLLRELLMHRIQLGIQGGVVMLCRSKRNKSAEERTKALLSQPMFSFLSDMEKETLVTVVEGDMVSPGLGLTADDMEHLVNDLDISHVINSAACVNFTEPLENAAESNITSALQLQNLAKRIRGSGVKYIYLSTAFIHGDKHGSPDAPLPETLFDFGHHDPAILYKSMMETQSCASAAMKDLGFPNTYTFSKSICEHLLLRDKGVETIIVRPSIVGPAVQIPHEGWAGDKPSTLVAGACLYLKSPCNIWTFGQERAAVIPVDVVCRFVIAKAFDTSPDLEESSSNDETVSDASSYVDRFSDDSCRSSEESYMFTKHVKNCNMTGRQEAATEHCRHSIHTAAWSFNSPPSTGFQWYDFACAIVQLASSNGHVDKALAYLVLLFSFKMFLSMDLSFDTFQKLHKTVVHLPISCTRAFFGVFGLRPKFLRSLDKLSSYLDLPVLFFPFTTVTYHFESSLCAPLQFNAERYMFSCILSAEKFIVDLNHRLSKKKGSTRDESYVEKNKQPRGNMVIVAGRDNVKMTSDLWWSLTQPNGNYAIRFIGWIVIKVLRVITTEVTVDIESFSRIARAKQISQVKNIGRTEIEDQTFVILAPTHRSLLDFIILSFIAFALPELGLGIPSIAAADEFSRVPVLGFFARLAGAFFLRRGKGVIDPSLGKNVESLKKRHSPDDPTSFEVFLEGKRSRDRRFVKPKTGFLRCLVNTKGNHVVVPITINYETIPEQSALATEADGQSRQNLSLHRLFTWLRNVKRQKVNVGKIHVSASPPILMQTSKELNVQRITKAVQQLQQKNILVSKFHISAGSSILQIDESLIAESLRSLGCSFWPDAPGDGKDEILSKLPQSLSEKWTVFLHYGHFYATFLQQSHPTWAAWLNDCNDERYESMPIMDENVAVVVDALKRNFNAADDVVEKTIRVLEGKGFSHPLPRHIMQYIHVNESNLPALLLQEAISSYLISKDQSASIECISSITSPVEPLFRKGKKFASSLSISSEESFGAWGYTDSGFVVNVEKNGNKTVIMKGDRYKISGNRMPKLIPFLESETELVVNPRQVILPATSSLTIPGGDLSQNDLEKLFGIFDNDKKRVSTFDIDRARHGTGHSQDDMYMIRSDTLSEIRLPDAVVYPQEEFEVEELVSLAAQESWCLIPFGGGTNVCHATWCPPKSKEPRPIISVDTKLLNRILAINEEDSTLHVQSGITGGDLVREMQSLGFTIGHEPDSIEFSTLGGWIATKASGMKQNKYGNIEDIVKEVRVVTSTGKLWQHSKGDGSSFGRVSTGTDFSSLMMGSEGSLGIITSAVIKIWPIPEVKEYDSVILHNFEDGLRFVKDVSKLGILKPASVRLLDNTQFRLGQAMKPKDSFVSGIKRQCMKALGSLFTDQFHSDQMVCATITFEGSKDEVRWQMRQIRALASKHGGLCAGSEIGRAGYDLTYAIAYIRDFAMTYGFLAESFETFVPWSKVKTLIIETKARLRKEHRNRALPGNPIITCRVTQLYDEGVCVYFYFCMNFERVLNPSCVFAQIELAARKEILSQGGSLSHHHGIGKHRAPLMTSVNSADLRDVFMKLKAAIDPENVFGVRNGTYAQ